MELKGLSFSESEAPKPQVTAHDGKRAEVKEVLVNIITSTVESPRNQKILEMLNKLDFWNAPASSKPEYHGSYPGGLADHTLLVLRHMAALNQAWECGVSDASIVVAAVMHDVSKAGFNGMPYYLPKRTQKGKDGYEYNSKLPAIGQNNQSLYLCMQHGIELSVDEYQAILGQDGLYSDASKDVWGGRSKNIARLVYLMHFSDMFCAIELGV